MNFLKTIVIICAVLNSCSQEKKSGNTTQFQNVNQFDANSNTNHEVTTETAIQEDDGEIPREQRKVDPSTLRVYNLRAGNMRQKASSKDMTPSVIGESVGFEASGDMDFLYYKFCPLEKTDQKCPQGRQCDEGGACVENITVFNRVIVPPIFEGEVSISMRACVDPPRSLAKDPCGPWETITYNSHRVNERVLALINEKDRIIEELGQTQLDRRNAYAEYMIDVRVCMDFNARVTALLDQRVRFAEQFMKAPVRWLFESGKNLGYAIFQEPGVIAVDAIGKWASEIGKSIGKMCHDTAGEGFCGMMVQLGQTMKQFGSAMNPIHGLGKFSEAVHVLSDPERAVLKNCLADEKISRFEEQIDNTIKVKLTRLMQIKQELTQLGEIKAPK